MRPQNIATALLGSMCLSATTAYTFGQTRQSDLLAARALENFEAYNLRKSSSKRCKSRTISSRREWTALRDGEKKDYIAAVKCLMAKPAKSQATLAPGARSRYDDFLAVHINQTFSIHATGNFFSWHRMYIYAFEQALRTECSYNSHLPYVNWAKYSHDIVNAPMFDGSDASISGDGYPVPHGPVYLPNASHPLISIPPANGGGCIHEGPFADSKVNLGPGAPVLPDVSPNPRRDGLGYNPRCIRRDLNNAAFAATSDHEIASLIRTRKDISSFQNDFQGNFAREQIGLHTAGHYAVGGDPGGDFFASPGDPWFWLHHTQVDRVWWMWQNQERDVSVRTKSIAGTLTLYNDPPSRNATLKDVIDVGEWNAEQVRIEDVVSTWGRVLCYRYV